MLRAKELIIRHIGRFVDEQHINFSTFGSFTQVDGQNKNTGGSSGSGKSTIFQALDYLFGFPGGKPSTILQSRKLINPDQKHLYAKGIFEDDNGSLVIITKSKSLFTLEINGITYEKANAEEQLDKLLGMSRDLYRKMLHKRQDEGGFFLSLGPTDMHNFLMDCIGLSSFKDKVSIIDTEISELEKNIEKANTDLEKMQTGFSATESAIVALGLPPIKEVQEATINELKEKANRSVTQFIEVRDRCGRLLKEYANNRPNITDSRYGIDMISDLEKRKKDIESQILNFSNEDRKNKEGIRNLIEAIKLRKSDLSTKVDRAETARSDIYKLVAEIKSMQSNICPTCLQEWKNEKIIDSINKMKTRLLELKKVVDDGEAARGEFADLCKELHEHEQKFNIPFSIPTHLSEELHKITQQLENEKRKAKELYDQQSTEMKAKLDAFVRGQTELQKKCDLELDQARGQMDVDQRVLNIAEQKIKSYEIEKTRYDSILKNLHSQLDQYRESIRDCKDYLKVYEENKIFALETKKAIKYFISYSFDEALGNISDKATQIIRCIPNTSNATIYFEGSKETQSGKVKEEINAILSLDGEEAPIKSFSGGERSSIDLAVDLAVIDYLETKSGKGMDIFILDEPFKGLGTIEIEQGLEVLKNSHTNKKIIIVDHNPEVKEIVQNRIVVVREGLTSNIIGAA